MQLLEAVKKIFVQLTDSIERLSPAQYIQPCESLTNHTIGQHVRHIIELFQCLEIGYILGNVDYEKRKRDVELETNKDSACRLLARILANLDKPNKNLNLSTYYSENSTDAVLLTTNYHREIAYNLEHTIHHMALMRIGIAEISNILLSEDFGVAPSTLKYRRQCAQ